MNRKLKRIWRSATALCMAFVMMFSTCGTVFAEGSGVGPSELMPEKTINYVSIGDSMANGYGFVGYKQSDETSVDYDFMNDKGVYGNDAYPIQFEEYLTGQGYGVEHTKLATSAMLAEDLLYLLGGREEFDDGWNGYKDYVGDYEDKDLMPYIQNAVTKADIITMGIGNASFGAFLLNKITDALGVFDASLDEDEKLCFEDAITVLNLDAEQYALVMEVYDNLISKLVTEVPGELVEQYNLDTIVDLLAYTTASYVVNYKLLVEKILNMNPDVEIILVGLLNTTYGMNVVDDNGKVILPFGDVMDGLFGTLNAYMAGLPTVLQEQGIAKEAKFYYAEETEPEFICQVFDELKDKNWETEEDDRLDASIVRERNISAYNSTLAKIIGEAVIGASLPKINMDDIKAYDGSWTTSNAVSVAVYLAIEEAVASSIDTMDIPLTGLMKIAGDLSEVFSSLGEPPMNYQAGDTPEDIRKWLVNGLSTEETQGMCKIYGLFKVGNGMSVHPTPDGHDSIADKVIAAYESKYTAKDATIDKALAALEIIGDVVAEYYDEAYAYAYAYAKEEGYIDTAVADLDEASKALDAVVDWADVNQMSDAFRAELKDEVAAAKATIAEIQKLLTVADVLDEETYAQVNVLLDSLYENLVNITELLDIAATDLNAAAKAELTKLGNAVWAEYLEAKEYVEENLPKALGKAYDFLVEKAGDAFEALADAAAEAVVKYGPEAVAWVYDFVLNNPDKVIAFFEEYGDDAVAFVKEYQNEIFAVLGFLVMTFGEDVANYVMENPVEVLKVMCELVREYGDEAWALIKVYATELGLTAKVPTTDDIKNALINIYDLLNEYGPGIYDWAESEGYIDALEEAVESLLAAIDAEIQNYLESVKPEMEAALDALKAELAALQAQLDALKAQLENANEELKTEIEAAIAVIEAQIAELEAAMEALEAKLAEIAEAFNALYEAVVELAEAIEELIAISTGKVEGDVADVIEKIQDAYDKVLAAIDAAKDFAEVLGEVIADAIEMAEAICDQVTVLKEAACEAVEAIKAAIAEGAANIVSHYEEELAAIQAALEAVGEEVWAEAQAQIEALNAELAVAVEALNAELLAQVEALKAQAQAQIEALNAQAEAQIAELTAAAEAEIARIQAEVEAQIAELTAALEQAAEEAKAEIFAQVEALNAQAEAQIAAVQAALEAEIAKIQAELVAAVEAMNAAVEAQIAELTAAVEAQIAELTAAVQAQIEALNAAVEEQIAELKAAAEEAAKEAIAAIEAAKAEALAQIEALLEAVDTAVQEVLDAVDAQIMAAAVEVMEVAEVLANDAMAFLAEKLDEVIAAYEKAYIGATTGEYTVSEDSYYVSIGDSLVEGLGLNKKEATFGERLAEALGLKLDSQFAQLGQAGLRAEDIRYILDETFVPDAYGEDLLAEDVEELRGLYTAEIEKADLVTVALGNDNISAFVTTQLQKALAGKKTYAMDWTRYVGEEGAAHVAEKLAGIYADLKESGLDDYTAGLALTAVESYAYGYVGFVFNYAQTLNRIHEINPEALVIVVGAFNPIDNMVIDLNGTEVAIGEYANGLVELTNLQFTLYAMLTPGTTFVTIPDTETVMDAEIADGAYENVNMISYVMALLGTDMHANANGHEYIKDRILNALTVNYDYPLGDVNMDGKVTAADVNLLYRYVGGLATLSNLQKQLGDVNQDGTVTGADVNLLYRYVGGLAALN